jgi:general secretion pathway protein M
MLQMQAQAELLRQQPQGNRCAHAAEQSLKTELGSSAQLQWLGNRAQVSLSNAAAPAPGPLAGTGA